jgi:hypothetical protein
MTISGSELNRHLDNMPIFKYMNDSEIHHGIKYQDGLNQDLTPFDGTKIGSHGLHVSLLKDYQRYYNFYGKYARRVRVPDTAQVHVTSMYLKCDKIYLEERMPKDDLLKILFTEYLQNLVDQENQRNAEIIAFDTIANSVNALKFIDSRFLTEGMLKSLIHKISPRDVGIINVFENIDQSMRTPGLISMIRNYDSNILRHIINTLLTYQQMIQLVKFDPQYLQYIDKISKTEEMILEAVKSDGTAIQFIEKDMLTPCLILEAVKNDGCVSE